MKPQAANNDPPKPKLEVTKIPRKNDTVEAHPSTTQKVVAKPATRKKSAQKARNLHFFLCHFYFFVFLLEKYAFC